MIPELKIKLKQIKYWQNKLEEAENKLKNILGVQEKKSLKSPVKSNFFVCNDCNCVFRSNEKLMDVTCQHCRGIHIQKALRKDYQNYLANKK